MRTRSSVGLERHTTDVEVIGSNPFGSAISQNRKSKSQSAQADWLLLFLRSLFQTRKGEKRSEWSAVRSLIAAQIGAHDARQNERRGPRSLEPEAKSEVAEPFRVRHF